MAAGFLGEFASRSDLAAFQADFDPAGAATPLTIVGPNDASSPGVEADLDVQYIIAMGAGVATTFWYQSGTRPSDNEPFLEWLNNVTAAYTDATIPKVISISYGDNEDTVDPAWGMRVGSEFAALGARGVSVLVSSGDGGVAGSQSSPCPHGFIPTFPAGRPYVTAVGATTNPAAETTASFSSGGFSNYWPRPDYQAAAVARYLATAANLPPASLYNGSSGAGIPDVAALGTDFQINYQGHTISVDGTSCSAPAFAGLVSLLNSQRLAAGKTTLGWLNPMIYAAGSSGGFNDITTGTNPGCGTKGFEAAAGWDPETGGESRWRGRSPRAARGAYEHAFTLRSRPPS
jgi:tripeptidyl-peptidase-1